MTAPAERTSAAGTISPATTRPLPPVKATDPRELPAIVAGARQAHRGWAAKTLAERYRALAQAADAILAGADEIAEIVSDETGKSVDDVLLNEVSGIAEYVKLAYREAKVALQPHHPSISSIAYPGKKAVVEAVARGVIGIIAPWNYPLSIFYKPIFPALLAGNAVVLKPSEYTPRTGAWLGKRLAEYVGEEVVSVVQGDGAVGAALVESGVDAITFTGSVATGRKVAARAGELLIPASVELGGKDAAIVLADCDLERTLAGVVQWGFHNCGQNCGAIERVYVEASIADEFVDRLGALAAKLRVYPEGEQSEIGPLQSAEQRSVVEAHVADALDRGARLVTGGERVGSGFGYLPTVLDGCTEEMAVMWEETFGPVLAVARVADADEAVERANRSPYGLNGSIWTSDLRRGQELARRLEVGTAFVNNHAITGAMANLPWTGTGHTGPGIAASRFSYPTFIRRRTIFVDKGKKPDPWWFPFDESVPAMASSLIAFSRGKLTAGLKLAAASRRRVRAIEAWVSQQD